MKKKLFLSLIGLFVSLILSTYAFSLTLYDDFSGTYIDRNKWRYWEYVREINVSNHKFVSKVAPDPNTITSYPYVLSNNFSFADSGSVNSIQADVSVLEITHTNPNPGTRARVAGYWYNDGTPGGGYAGDILAEVFLGATPQGGLTARWEVTRLTNAGGTAWAGVANGEFMTPISFGGTYALYIEYDRVNHRFIFRVGSEEKTFGPTGLPARVKDANMPYKMLRTRVYLQDATQSGYISATFDNVYKNGMLYDDFSSPIIDETKWIDCEYVREISEGKLRSEVSSSSASTSTISNRLEFIDPTLINVIQAKVTPLTYSNNQQVDTLSAYLGGYCYNDGTPGGGRIGDVLSAIGIGGEGINPIAGWKVVKCTDSACQNQPEVASGTFTTPISLGNTYTLFWGWDGSRFIFKFDDEVAHYTPVTSMIPPNLPRKEIATLIMNPAGKEAMIEALFDDVMVGAACCPAIDVNPQSIDFGKVLPGGTSDQTVLIKNVGSVTLTLGTIGSPSPPFSITGGTCSNNQTLPPQGSCTLIIGFAPTAYGVYTSSFTIPSDDPVNSVVTVNPINGTSPDHFTLTISKSGTGNGTVTSSPAGINCGSDCTEDFKVGTKITLKAKADANSTFTGWSGGGCSGTGTCVVIMNDDATVTAGFAAMTPDISVAQTSLDFGSVNVGKKITKTLKIANNGSGDLLITLSGLEGTDFSIQGSSSVTIKAKKTYSLKVLCTPTSGGLKTAKLKIQSNDPDTPTLEISLTATLPATTPDISVAQTSLDFGSVKVGKKVTKTLKITNNGTGDLMITLSGLEGTDFSIQGSSSVTIKGKKSYTLKVLCTPTSGGLKTATLEIHSNDPDTPTIEISLTAALPATTPDISVAPTSLDFGVVMIGEIVTKEIKITNNGSGDLVITLSGLAGTDFSISGSPNITIKSKESYFLQVTFARTSAGLKTATLKIDSNDPDTPTIEISLSGTGPSEEPPDIGGLTPTLDFGSIKVGTNATKTLKPTNYGSGNLVITLSGLAGTDFSISGSTNITIKSKKSYDLAVTFTPKSAGLKTATLEIHSNDPDTPTIDISLSGTGQTGQ
jgi:hypothetical protein